MHYAHWRQYKGAQQPSFLAAAYCCLSAKLPQGMPACPPTVNVEEHKGAMVCDNDPALSIQLLDIHIQTHEERGATAQQCLLKRCSKAYQACIHCKGLVGCCHSYNSRSAPLLSTAPPERGAAASQLHQAQRQYRRRECRLRAASTIAGATSE
jgi:hypothetical protein